MHPAFTAVNHGTGALLSVVGTDGKSVDFATVALTGSGEVTLVLVNGAKMKTVESTGRMQITLPSK